MPDQCLKSDSRKRIVLWIRRLLGYLIAHASSAIIFGALFCTLTVKFFHAIRTDLLSEYHTWILSDVCFLLLIELFFAVLCYRWPRRAVLRATTIMAALVCTWSVMNAGWLIRTGTQILPRVLLPVFRDPLNALLMIGVNFYQAPIATVALMGPSAVALTFLFYVLAKPRIPTYNSKAFSIRALLVIVVILVTLVMRPAMVRPGSFDIRSLGLRYNSQMWAFGSLLTPRHRGLDNPKRELPCDDTITLSRPNELPQTNVVLVILEGVQYRYTSLSDVNTVTTPFLARFAKDGVEFTNTRSTLTHTTKAVFSLLSGRFPSASQDLAETVPARKPYLSLATILRRQLGYRTAFFQSAKGNFESRSGLIHNLGYEKFYTRDDLNDPNSFIGYLACDEFAMLKPLTEWLQQEDKPFFLTYLCSITHDPYEVPEWFGQVDREPLMRYRQTISYTDTFLSALDAELCQMGFGENTIFCIVSDHAEAFGEHGLLGHERIAYDEVLHIPLCLRAPFLIEAGRKVTEPVSSIDVTPTILGLLGFDTVDAGFDGMDVLGEIPLDRKVYFSGWIPDGPAGYVCGDSKFIYNPANSAVLSYNLADDPREVVAFLPVGDDISNVMKDITDWRESTIFRINQGRSGRKVLFDHWLCWWTNRVADAKYEPSGEW